jgi:NAD(P)-dependent dehydrogenase (short-subunit alcohol dehydrogenase family)
MSALAPGLAVVTGASRGIGLATAARLLADGWTVLAVSRSPCPLEGVRSLRLDLCAEGSEDAVGEAVVEMLGASAGRVCVVHNAARLQRDSSAAIDAAAMRATLELNVVVPARLNRVLLPLMVPGSSIVFVGSTLGDKAVPGSASYVVSKHALNGLMRATCQDLAGTGIHAACVCPGLTATEMLLDRADGDPTLLATLGALSTFGRLIEPAEIADFIAVVANTPVVNGAVLHANLGQVEQ